MAEVLQLEIVTPERLVEKDTVSEVQIPGKDGYLGILPGHAPLITELGVETAERANEIDLPRAQKAKQAAEQRLHNASEEDETDKALNQLARAETRIAVAEGK